MSQGVVRLAVLGAGSRGRAYGGWVSANQDRAKVVAVAEPDPIRRRAYRERHGLPEQAGFTTWQELLAAPKLADAVLICLHDTDHVQPTLAALAKGYHVLLEKPMAPSEAECRQISVAAEASGLIFGVCHVLRYTPYTKVLRQLLADDAVGQIRTIEHLEPVGWWHHAHSYVRGTWAREQDSGPMLLAKGCHDLDWLQYLVDQRITKVASFGGTSHFVAEQAPPGATKRCLDCPLADSCAYSATRLYLGDYRDGQPLTWPRDVLTAEPSRAALTEALRVGPYGRCVYFCDNDVVDHQVVTLEFTGQVLGTFTMSAFAPKEDRKTRIFGTNGFLDGDGKTIRHVDFRTGIDRKITVDVPGSMDAGGGHGGGDAGVMDAFTAAVASGDSALVSSDAAESLSGHLAVFASERARHSGTVESLES